VFGFLPGHASCCSKAAACYRAHFCGLCNVLRQEFGLWSRFLINRDSTFLNLLGSAMDPHPAAFQPATCCNPLGKAHPLLPSGPVPLFVSSVTVCGLIAKLQDDMEDERGPRRMAARFCGGLLAETEAKATGLLHAWDFPTHTVRAHIQPASGSAGFVEQATHTGLAYAEITAFIGKLSQTSAANITALRNLGHQLGLLIHLKDAWDDFDKDRTRGRDNPLNAYPDKNKRREALRPVMESAVASLRTAFASLTLHRNRDMLNQIVIEGSERQVQEVLNIHDDFRKQKKENKKRRLEKDRGGCCSRCDCGGCDCCPGNCSDIGQCCRCGKSGKCDCNPCDGDCCGCDCSP